MVGLFFGNLSQPSYSRHLLARNDSILDWWRLLSGPNFFLMSLICVLDLIIYFYLSFEELYSVFYFLFRFEVNEREKRVSFSSLMFVICTVGRESV